MDNESKELRDEVLEKCSGGEDNPMELKREEWPRPEPKEPLPKPGPGAPGAKADKPCPLCGGTNVLSISSVCTVGEPALYHCLDCMKGFKA